MQVAVLGTGTMGAGMARSLLRAGHGVRAWNRSPDKAGALAEDGATVAASAADAVAGADVVVTMLFDTDAVLSVLGEVAPAFGPDTILVQSSTVGLDGIAGITALAERHSLALLDAPVVGTKQPAENGQLVVLASGDSALRPRVQPAFDAIGSKTVWVGAEIGAASALKLVANAWIASINAATAQSVALAGGLGLDPTLFLEAIKGGAVDSAYAHVKAQAMMHADYAPSFTLDGVRKDLDLIRSAAAGAGVATALLDALAAIYSRASDTGHGDQDMAAVRTAFGPGST